MPSVSDFRGAIRAGLQRNNRFNVNVNYPSFAGSNDTARQASLLARTATLPESTLGNIDVAFAGRNVPNPGDRQFNDWTVTFIATQDWNARNAFETWQQNINGNDSNSGSATPEEYMRDIVFDLLDSSDNVVASYVLRDAWPLSISGGDVDAGAMDSFMEFTVTFKYTSWSKAGVSL